MTSEQLFDTIGQTEETLLARSEKPHRAALFIKMGIAAAAALAIIIGLAAVVGNKPPHEDLPLIEFETYSPYGGGTSFAESYPTDPISVPGKLAVYQNHSFNSEGVLYGLSAAEAESIIYAVAAKLNMQTVPIEYRFFETVFSYHLGHPGDGFPSGDTLYQTVMHSDDGTVSVSADGSFYVNIADNGNTDVDSPNESIPTSDEEWIAKARLLFEQYRELCALDAPTFTVEHGEDTVYVYVSEATPNPYHYRRVSFLFSKNGTLQEIRHCNEEMEVEKLADYPTISQADAKELLLDGHFNELLSGGMYIDYRNITEQQIVGCALTYRQTVADRFFIPYYTFYVDLKDTENAYRKYAVFYVPAIDGRYIKGFLSDDNSGTVATARPITTNPTAPTRYPAAPTDPPRTTVHIPTTPTTVKPSGSGGVILELLPENQKGAAPSGTSVAFEKVCSGRIRHFDAPTYQSIADAATYHQIPWEYATGNRPAYDDAFFEDKALIRLDTVLPDPSYSKTVTKLYRNGDVLEVVMVTLHETGAMVPAEAVPYTTVLSVDRAAIEGVTKIAFYNGEAGIPITFRAEGPYAAEVAEFDTEWVFIDSNAQYSSLPWPSAATGIPMYSDSAFIDRRLVSVTLTLPSNCHAVRIDEVRMFENKIENRLVIYYTPTYYSNVDNTGTTKILRLLVWVDREQTEKISYAVITQNTPEFTQADIPPFHWEESAPVKNGPIGTPVSYTQEYLTTGAHDSRDEQLYRPITDVATYQSINWKLSANDTPPTYDTAFFENKALIVLPFVHSAANYRATVTGLYRNGDTLEVLYTQTTIAAVGAAALWENRFLMAVDAADIEGVTRIAFYKNEHDAVVLEETEPTGGTEGPLGTSIEFKSIAYDSGLSADKPLYRTITDLYTYEHLSWSNGYTPPALDADFFETYALVELCDSFPHSGYHWEIDSVSVNSNYTLEIAQTVTLDNGDQVVTGARHLLAIRHTDLKRVGLIAFYTTTTKSPQA